MLTPWSSRISLTVLLLGGFGVAACTGVIGEPPPPVGGVTQPLCQTVTPGRTSITRLTSYEFDNTIKQLFGNAIDPGDSFPRTTISDGYRSYAEQNIVTPSGADGISRAAEDIVAQAVVDLPALMGCNIAAANCLDGFIRSFGKRVYRRPVSEEEVGILQAAYDKARAADFDETEAAGIMLEIMIQSPQFLYRVEVASITDALPGEAVALSDYELATRLSYLMWDSMPDDTLFTLADEGRLHEPQVLEEQARRLFDDPRAQPAIGRFVEDWMEIYRLDGASKLVPEFDDDMRTALQQEIQNYVSHVVWELDGSLETLLSEPVAVVNGPLASLYEVPAPNGGAWQPTQLDADRRAGILTTTAFMAAHSNEATTNPVARGAFVRAKLLCQILFPPAGLVIEPLKPNPGLTIREKLAQHREDPACAYCHTLMDPIGFGMENYDVLGRWRTVDENGFAVDASGELASAGEASGSFVGAVELAQQLANSEMVRSCVAVQAFRFAAGREHDAGDSCSIADIEERFVESNGSIRELMVGVAMSDAFRYRLAEEVTP